MGWSEKGRKGGLHPNQRQQNHIPPLKRNYCHQGDESRCGTGNKRTQNHKLNIRLSDSDVRVQDTL